jgi:heavy metal translocating P-type ATPase
MKRLTGFVLHYKLFSASLLVALIALIFELTKHPRIAHILLTVACSYVLLSLLTSMWHKLRSGSYGIDILAATSIVTAIVLDEYWAAIVVVLMLTGGEALEHYAERRAKSELDSLLEHAPRKAHVIRKGKTIAVNVSEIHVGDKILIKAGELVPVDATVIDGIASFDESSLTGESLPQSKQVGDQLLSGAINLDGPVTAKALATADESQYQQIIKLVRAASANQAPFVRLADRYSLPFTFAAYAIASAVWIMTGDAIRFLEVIIVATPCPLLLAAPIAVISGMARASRFGIIVKTGSALERLAEARTMVFDKTGTLTTGVLAVDDVRAYGSHTQEEVLAMAASLEQSSNHVVALAIVGAARDKKLKFSKAKHVQEVSGRGLRAQLKGYEILVGRLSLLEEHDIALPAKFKASSVTQTAAYVAIGGELAGVILLSDEIRPESPATLARLRQLGLPETVMVTGDNQATALLVAKKLGIDQVHAETLPADKLRVIETIKARPLVFVGDGVNDAPVLTASDVGIALGARGSTAASESADMVIMLDDLGRVASGVEIAKRTFKISRQSILIGIGLSLVLMGVFATGKFTPLAGALVQEVVDVFVIFNALRAHLITPSQIGE